jgi:hypothetical protein
MFRQSSQVILGARYKLNGFLGGRCSGHNSGPVYGNSTIIASRSAGKGPPLFVRDRRGQKRAHLIGGPSVSISRGGGTPARPTAVGGPSGGDLAACWRNRAASQNQADSRAAGGPTAQRRAQAQPTVRRAAWHRGPTGQSQCCRASRRPLVRWPAAVTGRATGTREAARVDRGLKNRYMSTRLSTQRQSSAPTDWNHK